MRWSRFYLYTTREVPRDAEVISHQLMIRSGMIKKVAAGIYSYLPSAQRSLHKLENIIRVELEKADCVELSMPAVQPAELWEESGRWQEYGKELLRIHDRHGRDFAFGPTHEEVITDIVRGDVRSYKQLPINLYQIQTKFRDEIRPRFGLMRGREFIMKDAYSFHTTSESLDETYRDMHDAYCRIFEACGLDYIVVEADTGSIGGSSSHEFMVLADTGEDAVVRCNSCHYAANVEKAETCQEGIDRPAPGNESTVVATPDAKTVEEVAAFLNVEPSKVVKTLIYDSAAGLVAVAIRGDREINEIKLANYLDVSALTLAGEEKILEATGAPTGFAGPVGLSSEIKLVADRSTELMADFITGANENDAHRLGVNWGRDAEPEAFVDFLLVGGGDACPRCEGTLEEFRGIEVGHIFKLGDKYSKSMGCNFLDQEGKPNPMLMGCYGLGVGRTLAAAIEQNNDENGVIWPIPLAPFEVILIALGARDETVNETAEVIYGEMMEAGIKVLFDDRKERPGVKFKDADLVGIPVKVVVGARSLAEGKVEISLRKDGDKHLVDRDSILGEVMNRISASGDDQ